MKYERKISLGHVNAPKKSNQRSAGLGRGLESLSGDNSTEEKKPLVVRRGVVEEGRRTTSSARPPIGNSPGVGGRVVIRTEALPEKPLRSSRQSRKGTTVLVRTERPEDEKQYGVDGVLTRGKYQVLPGRPIVINPRKKRGK